MTVRLFLDIETAAAIVPPTLGTLAPDLDGSLLRIGTDDLDWAARRLVALGCDFDVVDPPELAQALGDLGTYLTERFAHA